MQLNVAHPAANQHVQSGAQLTVSGTASSGTSAEPEPIVSVTIVLDSQTVGPKPVPPKSGSDVWTFSATFTVSSTAFGPSQVTVTAVDGLGVTISRSVPIVLDKPSKPPPPPVDTTGLLTFITVSDGLQSTVNFARFGLKPSGGTEVVFEFGPNAIAADWIIHAAELAVLREALISKLQVTVTHDPTLSVPMLVKVMAPP